MIISLVIWVFIGFATNVAIDYVGFPKWITKSGENKKAITIVFSIFWPLYYLLLLTWVTIDLYEWIESKLVVSKGHRCYIGNRIALYSFLVALLFMVVMIVVRKGGIE